MFKGKAGMFVLRGVRTTEEVIFLPLMEVWFLIFFDSRVMYDLISGFIMILMYFLVGEPLFFFKRSGLIFTDSFCGGFKVFWVRSGLIFRDSVAGDLVVFFLWTGLIFKDLFILGRGLVVMCIWSLLVLI